MASLLQHRFLAGFTLRKRHCNAGLLGMAQEAESDRTLTRVKPSGSWSAGALRIAGRKGSRQGGTCQRRARLRTIWITDAARIYN